VRESVKGRCGPLLLSIMGILNLVCPRPTNPTPANPNHGNPNSGNPNSHGNPNPKARATSKTQKPGFVGRFLSLLRPSDPQAHTLHNVPHMMIIGFHSPKAPCRRFLSPLAPPPK